MTLAQAGKITGLRIEPTRAFAPKIGFEAYGDDGLLLSWGSGCDESQALDSLVKRNWGRVSAIVLARAKWKCEECGRMTQLQVHHIEFRSHGRRDVPGNLLASCPACHHDKHSEVKGLAARIAQMEATV